MVPISVFSQQTEVWEDNLKVRFEDMLNDTYFSRSKH